MHIVKHTSTKNSHMEKIQKNNKGENIPSPWWCAIPPWWRSWTCFPSRSGCPSSPRPRRLASRRVRLNSIISCQVQVNLNNKYLAFSRSLKTEDLPFALNIQNNKILIKKTILLFSDIVAESCRIGVTFTKNKTFITLNNDLKINIKTNSVCPRKSI